MPHTTDQRQVLLPSWQGIQSSSTLGMTSVEESTHTPTTQRVKSKARRGQAHGGRGAIDGSIHRHSPEPVKYDPAWHRLHVDELVAPADVAWVTRVTHSALVQSSSPSAVTRGGGPQHPAKGHPPARRSPHVASVSLVSLLSSIRVVSGGAGEQESWTRGDESQSRILSCIRVVSGVSSS